MQKKWADYSFARPTLAQMRHDGIVGVLRYLSPDTPASHGKILFAPEKDSLLLAGFDIALNFEWYEGRCNEGYQAGVIDGQTAFAQAKGLGYPAGKTIYFSHDTGSYNWTAIEDYFRGVRAALGGYYKIGAYGSYELIGHLHQKGLIEFGWQTLAWSFGQRDPWAVIYQNGTQLYNGSVDLNEVTSTNIGSWLDGPTPVKEGFLVALTDAQQTDILKKVDLGWEVTNQTQNLLVQVNRVVADLDLRIASLQKQVDLLKLTASTGVDIPALVKAINDDAAKRMGS